MRCYWENLLKSQGKRLDIYLHYNLSEKAPAFAVRSESAIGLKSLNAPYKKREMARISSENESFARRLISQ